MSLINEMLQDLDRNKSISKTADHVSSCVVSPPVDSYRKKYIYIFPLAILLLLVFCYFHFGFFKVFSSSGDGDFLSGVDGLEPVVVFDDKVDLVRSVSVAPADVSDDVNKALLVEAIGNVEPEPEPKSEIIVAGADVGRDHSDAISTLLMEADIALKAKHLTRPVDKNAFQMYQSVLLLDPNNIKAKRGIDKVQEAYIDLLSASLKDNKKRQWDLYSRRAIQVGVPKSVIDQYRIVDRDEVVSEVSVESNAEFVSGIYDVSLPKSNVINDEVKRLRRLAGFYQSQKKFDLAVPVYGRLVELDTRSANDWLGFAVSLDAEKEFALAGVAYKQVIESQHSNKRVMAFARKRIVELSSSNVNR